MVVLPTVLYLLHRVMKVLDRNLDSFGCKIYFYERVIRPDKRLLRLIQLT
jgi:hypothetical protein